MRWTPAVCRRVKTTDASVGGHKGRAQMHAVASAASLGVGFLGVFSVLLRCNPCRRNLEETASSLKDRGLSQRAVDELIRAFAERRSEQPSRYGGVNDSDSESDDNVS